jgi:hypothetical protein
MYTPLTKDTPSPRQPAVTGPFGIDAAAARFSLGHAYDDARLRAGFVNLWGADASAVTGSVVQLGGRTLGPGLYRSAASFAIGMTGHTATSFVDLILDGEGDSNSVFIFHSVSTTMIWNYCSVLLRNGAQARNVFWAVGSSFTIYGNSHMEGTVMCSTSSDMAAGVGGSESGAQLNGRILVYTGAVTLLATVSDEIGAQLRLPV